MPLTPAEHAARLAHAQAEAQRPCAAGVNSLECEADCPETCWVYQEGLEEARRILVEDPKDREHRRRVGLPGPGPEETRCD